MKLLYGSIVLFLCYFPAIGQITFEQLPKDLQLYPRDASNQANVVMSGQFTSTTITKIRMQVFREGKLTQVISQTPAPAAGGYSFSLSATIKAEPAEYSFRLFTYEGPDSTLIVERKRIVCGDVFIIHGQSNALATAELSALDFSDKYLRTVDFVYGGTLSDIYWYPAKQPFGSVGGIGLTIQRLILKNHNIPTCVINGAIGGATIGVLSVRDPVQHANPNTPYGALLYRAQWAGVAKQIKAIIWKQGEAESSDERPDYASKFTTLYNQFREDYGNARLYVGQINILSHRQDSAAVTRDFQRRTKYLFANVETIATVGTPGYGGVHYDGRANQQLATEQYRLIARDLYGSTDTLQISSPDIKKVFYNSRRDSVTLVFDDQMQMVWQIDTTFYSYATGALIAHRELKDVFYLDRQAGLVAGGSANGNRVVLQLKQPATAKALRYLPAYFDDPVSEFYDGPTLRNTLGMRAFSFDNVLIADAIDPVRMLVARPVSDKQVNLMWTPSPTAQGQILERAEGAPTDFKPIATVAGAVGQYIDTNISTVLDTHFYRLRATSPASESPYSNVARVQLVLGIEPADALFRLYPNPLLSDNTLHIDAENNTFSEVRIWNGLGQLAERWQGNTKNKLSLPLTNVVPGMIVVEITTADGCSVRRKVLVQP